jgi:hypothetical protein
MPAAGWARGQGTVLDCGRYTTPGQDGLTDHSHRRSDAEELLSFLPAASGGNRIST